MASQLCYQLLAAPELAIEEKRKKGEEMGTSHFVRSSETASWPEGFLVSSPDWVVTKDSDLILFGKKVSSGIPISQTL